MDELLSTLLAVMLTFVLGMAIFGPYLEEQDELRKDAIEKTEEYATYEYCEYINEKYYCFNEN